MGSRNEPASRRVLVLAPTGRDATLTVDVLKEAEIDCSVCRSAAQLAVEIGQGAGAAIIGEEALGGEGVAAIVAALDAQPSWSALPLLVMASDEVGAERLMATIAERANVTILQRPMRIAMLVSAVRAALGWRERQYETRDLLEQLQEADRQKDAFLATISHELRTPLNAIVGWTRIMGAERCEIASHARGLEVLGRNAAAQTTIIEDLLDMSRIITGKVRVEMRPVDLLHVVLDAVESVLPAARRRGITVDAPVVPQPVRVMGDADRLQQIAWNLISNAVKFTPEGGRVGVELGEADGAAFLRVTDTGRGIEPEFLPHLFERFRQADGSTTRRFGGLGLGLAIVRHLAELHGGSVRAESAGLGLGATFVLTLPIGAEITETMEPEPGAGLAEAALLARVPSLEGVRVLVVDDNADTIEVIRVFLSHFKAEVRGAQAADEGLALVRGWRPDVLVSDIAMPDRDGFWLIEQVRALEPEEGGRTPAVALTAFADKHDRARALVVGFQQHLPKPVSFGELAVTVASLAGRRSLPVVKS